MERGLLEGPKVLEPLEPLQIKFAVPGSPTPLNPIKAFQQGLHGELRPDQLYYVVGMRCSECGYLELYASKEGRKA